MTNRSALFPLTVRALAVLGGVGLVSRGTWWLAGGPVTQIVGPVLQRGPGRLPLELLLSGVCGVALLASVAWLAATTTLALTSYVAVQLCPRTRVARALARLTERTCPRLVRRAVTATVGVALGAGLAGPALAADHDPADHDATGTSAPMDLRGLPLPDRTIGEVSTPPRRSAPPPRHAVVVAAGDSLWSIASAHLPPGASAADTVAGWHRLARANAARLGGDPDLILPGTRLVVPDLSHTPRKDHP